jgi:hypothetical protein
MRSMFIECLVSQWMNAAALAEVWTVTICLSLFPPGAWDFHHTLTYSTKWNVLFSSEKSTRWSTLQPCATHSGPLSWDVDDLCLHSCAPGTPAELTKLYHWRGKQEDARSLGGNQTYSVPYLTQEKNACWALLLCIQCLHTAFPQGIYQSKPISLVFYLSTPLIPSHSLCPVSQNPPAD